MSARFAIYFMPEPQTALARFGASVMGYDAWSGRPAPFPDLPIYAGADAPAWTIEPARYGFHATLKAPFFLREGTSEADLQTLVRAFAAGHAPVPIGALDVTTLSRFIALCPRAPSRALAALAADCVTVFDGLRAPLTEADRARRLASPLTERQVSYLEKWGYPYVLDEFRFHMTLAGPLDEATKPSLKAALTELWQKVSMPVTVDAIAIARQADRASAFIVRDCCPLTGH